jgi:DNA invertase Pin-like site-specific DNA recombinase
MTDTAIGYIRVSTDEQAQDGVSLDVQRQRLQQYADLYEIELVAIIEDAGASAKTLKRDGLQTALQMLRHGKADALLVAKLDRLTRNVRDLGDLIEHYFGKYRLLSVADHIDTSSATGRLVLNVLGSVSQWEREQIAERTAAALQHKKHQREVYNHVPLGYEAADGRLVPIDEELRVVADIMALRDDGLSYHAIAAEMNARGIVGKRGGRFHASTIRAICVNSLHSDIKTAA